MTDNDRHSTLGADYREAMSRLACGVSLVTTHAGDGQPLGMLATAVTSVTADPPTLLVCVNRSASMHTDLKASGVFAVSFLTNDHGAVAQRFSSTKAREARFGSGDWRSAVTGSPLLGDALAALDCDIHQMADIGTHTVIFGRVRAIRLADGTCKNPMVYFDRRYCVVHSNCRGGSACSTG